MNVSLYDVFQQNVFCLSESVTLHADWRLPHTHGTDMVFMHCGASSAHSNIQNYNLDDKHYTSLFFSFFALHAVSKSQVSSWRSPDVLQTSFYCGLSCDHLTIYDGWNLPHTHDTDKVFLHLTIYDGWNLPHTHDTDKVFLRCELTCAASTLLGCIFHHPLYTWILFPSLSRGFQGVSLNAFAEWRLQDTRHTWMVSVYYGFLMSYLTPRTDKQKYNWDVQT